MKIFILFDIVNSPWGGGNQFLRTLRRYLRDIDAYSDSAHDADAILVNSNNNLDYARKLKDKVIIHRIDGVFSVYRGGQDRHNDLKVYEFSNRYSNGVIFQSQWSKNKHKENGMKNGKLETVIYNCADNKFFKKRDKKAGAKIRIVTSSWSDNIKKGFKTYKYLDNNLDFNKYEYHFIGRSPYKFKNIKMIGVLDSKKIANVLCDSDIFLTASQDDTCSNSLIEALTCGLPAVGLNSGGTPEIIKDNGEIFENRDDVIDKIEIVSDKLMGNGYNINIDNIEEIGKEYLDFAKKVGGF